jgi:anti-sigma factor RsiW
MSGQILKFDDSAHRSADAVLPWYVNGTLEEGARAEVEQHLRDCARCRREVEFLRDLRTVCAAQERIPPVSAAYGALRDRIDGRWPWDRIRQRLAAFVRPWRSAPAWTKGLMVAELAAIAALSIAIVPGTEPDAVYRTLGAPSARAAAARAVAVVFAPGTSEAELRRILLAASARIVDGPTASNAYVVVLPNESTDVSLATLRGHSAVVMAEPLTLPEGR